jgi:organic radical activating enzyme
MSEHYQDYGYIANIVTSFIEIPSKICSSVYFSGCPFNCPKCQNMDLQKFSNGSKKYLNDVINEINKNDLSEWVCFLGGEPLFQSDFLFELCKNISKPIGIYTGNDFDTLTKNYKHIIDLSNVKFLKTGKYIFELTKINEYPITSNQKIRIKLNNEWNLCSSRDIHQISEILENFS